MGSSHSTNLDTLNWKDMKTENIQLSDEYRHYNINNDVNYVLNNLRISSLANNNNLSSDSMSDANELSDVYNFVTQKGGHVHTSETPSMQHSTTDIKSSQNVNEPQKTSSTSEKLSSSNENTSHDHNSRSSTEKSSEISASTTELYNKLQHGDINSSVISQNQHISKDVVESNSSSSVSSLSNISDLNNETEDLNNYVSSSEHQNYQTSSVSHESEEYRGRTSSISDLDDRDVPSLHTEDLKLVAA